MLECYKSEELTPEMISDLLTRRSRWRLGLMIKHAANFQREFGYSLVDFLSTVQSGFEPGMSWENHGEWHVDHKTPICSFDFTDFSQYQKANHHTNLQPLWAADNLRKGGKNQVSCPSHESQTHPH